MKKKIIIYGIGTFFSKVLVFFMVPIYTRVFSTEDFGYYDVLIQNMQMLVSIAFLELWSGVLRFVFEGDKDETIKSSVKLFPVLLIIYTISFFILSRYIPIKYAALSYIYGITYYLFNMSNSISRGYEKNWSYVISGILSTGISCVLSIIFAVLLKRGIQYLIVAQIIGYTVAVIYIECETHAYIHSLKMRNVIEIKRMVFYCFPLMLNSFSYLFLGTYNKNVILQRVGESASGYYGYISKYSTMLSILISIFSLAWQEQAFSMAKDVRDNGGRITFYINLFIRLFGYGTPVMALSLFWASPVIGGEKYIATGIFIPVALFGTFLSGISGIFSTILAVSKSTQIILFTTVAGSIVNVILANVLIVPYGINGSNLCLCFGFGITTAIRYLFAYKKNHIKIHVIPLFVILIEIIVSYLVIRSDDSMIVLIVLFASILIWIFSNRDLFISVKELL